MDASKARPATGGPSEKERRYDRQLRLWASSGQDALESAHILLINTGPGIIGIETLKNLVLPGIGHFTIVDDAPVTDADLGANFFLDEGCLGQPRAEACAERLLELNPEVQGNWHPRSPPRPVVVTGTKKLCLTGPSWKPVELSLVLQATSSFSIIIYTHPINADDLALITSFSVTQKIPLVSVGSSGFYSYFQIRLPEIFPVIDTHPDETAINDLRLLNPWSELREFLDHLTTDMPLLDTHEHSHIPFIAILYYYINQWKSSHQGSVPATAAEKREFKALVQKGMRTNNAEGGEENFEEAVSAVLKAISRPELPTSLMQIFSHAKHPTGNERSTFWLIASAIQKFYNSHGQLPLPGRIPDMKTTSDVYVKLQNIYKTKARADALEVLGFVNSEWPGSTITLKEIELFCRNAAFARLINTRERSLEQVQKIAEQEFTYARTAKEVGMPPSLFPIYIALRSSLDMSSKTEDMIIEKIGETVPCARKEDSVRFAVREILRANGELHNIGAVTGGLVAQEVIKVITKQYVPIDNTCVFDGISGRCQTFFL